MDAMYRLDAIYPEFRENDNAFASLIAIVWLFLVDRRLHPADTRILKRLYDPYIKLRGDDILFISERLTQSPMDQGHIQWLTSFLTTSITRERRAGLIRKMWTIAYSHGDLHEAELDVIHQAAGLFALTDQETGRLREEGKAMAGRLSLSTARART